jgi:hypothetical protein
VHGVSKDVDAISLSPIGESMKIITKNYTVIFSFILLIILVMSLGWPSPAVADNPLPPRYLPKFHHGKNEKPLGAYIELHPNSNQDKLWTIVQWQDKPGAWHDVTGWQGDLDVGYKKVWWVALADFDKGPFRWVIYQGQGGKMLATSEPFYLPHIANETILVEVTLDH